MKVLVTGGAGYIGSHAVRELQRLGYAVTVYDNLSTGHRAAMPASVPFVQGDLFDKKKLSEAFTSYEIEAVVHFAASSLVGESMTAPALYYRNNVAGTLSLLEAMIENQVKKIVFSSTAAVYGEPELWPITENSPTQPTNVYGRTKRVIEGMLADFDAAYGLRYVSLRYFNAAGAWENGEIGEDHAIETHLIPLILKTALGQRNAIDVYGTDYSTPDGTCIRDYIHVTDLANAHVLALRHLGEGQSSRIYNLGSETGFSVRQVIEQAKAVTGVNFTVRETERRSGDPAMLVASAQLIREELGWKPVRSDLASIIETAWEWHKNNPAGYGREVGC